MMATEFQETGTFSLSISDWMIAYLVDSKGGISTWELFGNFEDNIHAG